MSKRSSTMLAILGICIAAPFLFGMKWYNIATKNPIDPQRGVWGMQDLELFIDINTKLMPDFGREWACKTLIAREAVAMGGKNTYPPHGCGADYKEQMARPEQSMIQSALTAHTLQTQSLKPTATEEQLIGFVNCVMDKVNTEVTTDQQVAANDGEIEEMKLVTISMSKAASVCREAM